MTRPSGSYSSRRKIMPKKYYNIEEIFQKYKNKIYWLAISITHNDYDAQDVLQNVFLKIVEKIKYFRGESHLATWIYRIAYNESLLQLKKKYRQTTLPRILDRQPKEVLRGLVVNWSQLPDEQLLDDEFKQRIEQTIRNMPIKYRTGLILHHLEGLSLKEMAKILKLNVNSLKTRLHRAYLFLRNDIAAYDNDIRKRTPKHDPKCGIYTKFVYDYLQQNLPKRKQRSFAKHINDCSSCKSFLTAYKKALLITKSLECQDIPPELQQKLETFLFKNR